MKPILLLLPLALVACGPSASNPETGDVSSDEASALNDAASMLDGERVDGNAVANASGIEGNES